MLRKLGMSVVLAGLAAVASADVRLPKTLTDNIRTMTAVA